jgi:NAD+ synthase
MPATRGGRYVVGLRASASPICEDAWHADVPETLAETGAEFLLVPNGSPYYRGKMTPREPHGGARVETGLPLVYLNLVGGQDDQVFDGGSFRAEPRGELALPDAGVRRGLAHLDLRDHRKAGARSTERWRPLHPTLGTGLPRDGAALARLHGQDRLQRVLLGLSGGVDSALVAAIAADALGPRTCAA